MPDRAPDGELVVDGGVLAGEELDDALLAELLRGQRLRVVPEEEVRSEPHELHRHVLRKWKREARSSSWMQLSCSTQYQYSDARYINSISDELKRQ